MKFSIITCTYNSAEYLEKNIDSVENQSYDDFEHVFIDGNSKDDTVDIIKKYQKKYGTDKIKFFRYDPQGISHAMNQGILHARGDWIIHLHSDDSFFDNNVLKDVSAYIETHQNVDWLYGKANFINPDSGKGFIIPHRKIYYKPRFWLLVLMNYIPHQATFIKKNVFYRYGNFDETLKYFMDYDRWLCLTKNKVRSGFVNRVVCNFLMRNDAASSRGKGSNENQVIFKKYISSVFVFKWVLVFRKLNSKRTRAIQKNTN